tara:strand:- start:943 stop:1149 length:207 start_codon:yes stop_codon:yes gene_type:complete
MYPSLFDSFFGLPNIIVVSEERLQAAEKAAKQKQLTAVKARIEELKGYETELEKQLEPQSLEEALTGE